MKLQQTHSVRVNLDALALKAQDPAPYSTAPAVRAVAAPVLGTTDHHSKDCKLVLALRNGESVCQGTLYGFADIENTTNGGSGDVQ